MLYLDGASRGNPGPAGIGIVIKDIHGKVVREISEFLGTPHTNNVAEYRALLRGLEEARRLGAHAVDIRSDSELMVSQLKREYKVRSPDLSPLFLEANRLLTSFDKHSVHKIARDENTAADVLANRAIDAAMPGATMEFSAIVEPAGVGFFARVPALGIEVEGKTRSEAIERARAAILEEVKMLRAAKRTVPKEERIRIRL